MTTPSLLAKSAVVISALAFVGGCSKPTEMVIPSNISDINADFGNKIRDLPEEDKRLLTAYLMRHKLGEAFGGAPMPIGTTVGQAIAEQKKWNDARIAQEAEAARLKKEIEEKQAAEAAELGKSVVMTLVTERIIPKNYDAGRYSDSFGIVIGVKNNGSKALKAVRGRLTLKNTFGDVINTTRLNIEETIQPGASYVWEGARKLNQFDDDDQKLMNLETGKFTGEVIPVKVVYADGTIIGSD